MQRFITTLFLVTDIFPVSSIGVITARDKLTIRWSPSEVWDTVSVFSTMDTELARQAYGLGKDAQDWKVEFGPERFA
jgi:hypothetical protein